MFWCLEMVRLVSRFRKGAFTVHFVAEQSATKSSHGPVFHVANTFEAGLDALLLDVDVVLVPGGLGTLREMFNPGMLKVLAQLTQKAAIVATVCSGSAILAATGALDHQPATTNKLSYNLLTSFRPAVDWRCCARWSRAGKHWTSSGVCAGTDMMLAIIAQLFDEPLAEAAAYRAEYVRHRDEEAGPFERDASPLSGVQLGHWCVLCLTAACGWVSRCKSAQCFQFRTAGEVRQKHSR